ncbi:MAG: FHA domain-containing protein [Anaerolineae bacterium]|nr:FHA domain-containing protein [Anaerolineae bacterium]
MVELIIQDGLNELLRQTLKEGSYRLGRTRDNDLVVPSSHLSRQHLQITVNESEVTLTDLGSTNGTQLRGRKLIPHTPTPWPENESVQIGGLTLQIKRPRPPRTTTVSPTVTTPVEDVPASQIVAHITCREAQPPHFTLERGSATVGSGIRCDIRLMVGSIENEHCRLNLHQNQLHVINLSQKNPVLLAGVPVPFNQPTPWSPAQALEVGYARLFYTLGQAAAKETPQNNRSNLGKWLGAAIGMGGILLACVILVAIMTFWRTDGPLIFTAQENENGPATPTLAAFVTLTPSPRPSMTLLVPSTPLADEPEESSCITLITAQENKGWLELPFPYKGIEPNFGGTAEEFRLISQRSRFGGRINSFFDHQYPMYPPAFGGQETDDVATTMLIFDGSLSLDAFTQHESEGTDARFDYYSGHAGIDFAPAPVGDPRVPQTPVFAAADGFLYTARVDTDGNHMVWLSHDRGEDGVYATLYFHLAADDFFLAMTAMEEGTEIPAGTRIGTMGTTGRSTGIHLHFEVRKDINKDGLFSIYEKIDPYGYFPTEQYPVDPWSEPWLDRSGRERDGIVSEYLWLHPLVDVDTQEDACVPQTAVSVDLYPIVGWSAVHPGFTYIARDANGTAYLEGRPINREVTVRPDALECVRPEDVRFQVTPYTNDATSPSIQSIRPTFTIDAVGNYRFLATISLSGRYVLAGPHFKDCVTPITQIRLSGTQLDDFTFSGEVTVTLIGRDRGTLRSAIKEVQYSLDCGQTWQVYTAPFTLTAESERGCGGSGPGQGIQLGPDDFLLLAIAEDSMNNIEQPFRQARFTVLGN